jgi:hypothetical protein
MTAGRCIRFRVAQAGRALLWLCVTGDITSQQLMRVSAGS